MEVFSSNPEFFRPRKSVFSATSPVAKRLPLLVFQKMRTNFHTKPIACVAALLLLFVVLYQYEVTMYAGSGNSTLKSIHT
jgi:hypothetical protein